MNTRLKDLKIGDKASIHGFEFEVSEKHAFESIAAIAVKAKCNCSINGQWIADIEVGGHSWYGISSNKCGVFDVFKGAE